MNPKAGNPEIDRLRALVTNSPPLPSVIPLAQVLRREGDPQIDRIRSLLEIKASIPPPTPVIPSSALLVLNAQVTSSITLAGAPAGDTSSLDNWNGLTQATPAQQPTHDLFNVAGGPAIIFGGYARPAIVVQDIFLSVGAVAISIPFTLALFGRFDNLNGNTPVLEIGNTSIGNGVLVRTGGSPLIKIVGPGGTVTATGAWNLCDGLPHDLIFTYDGSTLTILFDGQPLVLTISGSAGVGSIAGPMTLGNDHAQAAPGALVGALSFTGVWNRILTPSELANLRAYLAFWWYRPHFIGAAQYNTIAIGDSIQNGSQVSDLSPTNITYSAANRLVQLLAPRLGVLSNDAVGGAELTIDQAGPIPAVKTQWTATGFGQTVPGIPNIILLEGGLNDIAVLNPPDSPSAIADAVIVQNRLATVINQVLIDLTTVPNGGAKKHLLTVETMSFWSFDAFFDQCRNLVNANTLPTWGNAGNASVEIRVVASGEDIGLGVSGVPPYETFSPHLSQAGQQRRMGLMLRVLGDNGYLEKQETTFTVTPPTRLTYVGATVQLAAIATYNNANTTNIAASSIWISSNPLVATVSPTGLLTGVAPGTATISATDPATGAMSSMTATVVAAAVPTTVAGLRAWYRSDQGITLSAGNVTVWADAASGFDVSPPTPAKAPPYAASGGPNNLPFINWTGSTGQILTSTAFSATAPFEVFVVVDTTATVPGQYILDYVGGNANGATLYGGGPSVTVVITNAAIGGPSVHGLHIFDIAQNTPGNGTLAVDGGAAAVGTAPGANVTQLHLGNFGNSATNQSLGGPMLEVLEYNHKLSPADNATVTAYLKARYSIP